jgi:hypothetical protein
LSYTQLVMTGEEQVSLQDVTALAAEAISEDPINATEQLLALAGTKKAYAAACVIGAVAVFIGTLPGPDRATRFGETAARGVREAFAIFGPPAHQRRAAHVHAAIDGFARQLAFGLIEGLTEVTLLRG